MVQKVGAWKVHLNRLTEAQSTCNLYSSMRKGEQQSVLPPQNGGIMARISRGWTSIVYPFGSPNFRDFTQ